MTIAFFPSSPLAEAIDVTFSRLRGGDVTLRLLVDSGFTGPSSFVIGQDFEGAALNPAPALYAVGALQGIQHRGGAECDVGCGLAAESQGVDCVRPRFFARL